MTIPTKDVHEGLHSEQGAVRGDRVHKAKNPVIKVEDLAWLEFEKPDLDAAERFAHDFGFITAARTADTLYLRGALAGTHCVVIRQGEKSRFIGPAFKAVDIADVHKLAQSANASAYTLPGPGGGVGVDLLDPSGIPLRVVAGVEELPELPLLQRKLIFNTNGELNRVNATQRPPREPARVERLGHVVLESTNFNKALDWYQQNLGLIVSDFLYFPGQRAQGPTMAFIRCDRGSTPADHHTLAMTLGPGRKYIHSAFQVADLDALAAGSQYLEENRYKHSWGIGRHIEGSQLFDYWRDPDGFLVEHFTDGDMFDNTVEPGWAEMSASRLSQWGPAVTRDFLEANPSRHFIKQIASALADRDNEFTARRLLGLAKVALK
ncbi:VOC family protein [Hoyosella altamirensis]|uniref:Catechol 2,3-dioxygenase-like lactoylglutathione lyase family enzyme n=1 Tax=Hoyosella altamirensis TaxID=616997 RepID=A0A839RJE9_9ACTN|nr:VOC family protein [Hoyosella altamirensis]MBB3036580.1 catechol 2,3-dioxygenase-like lactoylglutathione lyase family enzyme [Hoyosella altamirensis]